MNFLVNVTMDGLGAEISVDDFKWWYINNNTCRVIFISPLKRCEFETEACRNSLEFELHGGKLYNKFGS